jgi:hypothetical protein
MAEQKAACWRLFRGAVPPAGGFFVARCRLLAAFSWRDERKHPEIIRLDGRRREESGPQFG